MTRRLRTALPGTPVVALDVDLALLSYVDGPRIAGDARRHRRHHADPQAEILALAPLARRIS
jgi:hypothetical protein